MREIACRFCQKITIRSTPDNLAKIGVCRHWCDTCQAEYLVWNDSDTFNSLSLYTNIKDKRYCWTMTATGHGVLWYIKTPETISGNRQVLFSLAPGEHQPDITPQNVADKIKTILVFL